MGGYNSGRHGGKALVEEALRVDLGYMLRSGLAKAGQHFAGTLRWTWGGEPCGEVCYDCDMRDAARSRLILSFTYRAKDGEEHAPIRQVIDLTYTVPHLGGRRWWMICPTSGERVGKLYLPGHGKRFASRKAWRLGYQSQRLAHHDRPFERMFRLQKRLGHPQGYDNGLFRPKGMWHRTYERHLERFEQIDRQCAPIWTGMLSRLRF
jgi:hypothetical protein